MLFELLRGRRAKLGQSGPPTELMLLCAHSFGVRDFVETGTFEGRTAAWAAQHFDRVVTIENSKSIYERTSARHAALRNVRFLFGNSRDVLGGVVADLAAPAVFWLDGHWSGGETYGDGDECPVLDEIRAVDASPHEHFVLIDDARLFASPPPRPHSADAWPSIDAVIGTLKAGRPDGYVVLVDDVVVRVPARAKEAFLAHCQRVTTEAFEAEIASRTKPSAREGVRLIAEGLRVVGEDLKMRLGRAR
jgi:hypothetical protein